MNGLYSVVVVSAAVGAAVGLGLGLLLREGPEPAAEPIPSIAAPAAEASHPDLLRLREALDAERRARIDQAEQIDLLWQELADLRASEPGESESDASVSVAPDSRTAPGGPLDSTLKWFDSAALLEHGFDALDADRIRERFEASELDELYLRDRATREGWINSARFRDQRRELRAQLIEDLGEDDYDWMLYAAGRYNRVRVDGLLRDSPAADAGLQIGDVILRYAGTRILDQRQLSRETTRGQAGETVAIDALRNDEVVRLYAPRGPLGIRTGAARGIPLD